MEKKEASKRFNELPRKHRTTIIGNDLNMEIRWLENEKREYIKRHQANIRRINGRIKILDNDLRKLKDD